MRIVLLVLLVAGLSYWAVRPLTFPGYFSMHDDTQISRVIAMGRELRAGQFPVRWVGDLGYGYGYPLFNFYGPLPYYLGGGLYALGVDALISTKVMFAVGIVGAALAMALISARYFGWLGGLVAGLFYTYAPYHAVQVYVRGAVGEYWTLMFFPLFLYGLWEALREDAKLRNKIIGIIGLAGIVLSHTIFGYAVVLLSLVSIAALFVGGRIVPLIGRMALGNVCVIIIGALGISAFFWIPAFAEMKYTNVMEQIGSGAFYGDHFVCLGQLWDSPWGWGGSTKGCVDGLSFKLGKIHILVSFIALAMLLLRPMKRTKPYRIAWIGLGLTSVALFLSLPVSFGVWQATPFMSYVQYPWRFLSIASLGIALLSGFLVFSFRSFPIRLILSLLLSVGVLALNGKLFSPQFVYERPARAFEDVGELRWRVSKISDEYLPKELIRPLLQDEVVGETIPSSVDLSVETIEDKATRASFLVTSVRGGEVTIRRAYFPGWRYLVNGEAVIPRVVHGLPRIAVAAGRSNVAIEFRDTNIRTIANMVSVITLLVLFVRYGKKTNS